IFALGRRVGHRWRYNAPRPERQQPVGRSQPDRHFICAIAAVRYVWAMISVPLRRILFWAAAIFAFAMAIMPHPPELPGGPSDKVQHVAAFATLGVLGAWAYVETPVLALFAGLSFFGAAIELVQGIPALHRDS